MKKITTVSHEERTTITFLAKQGKTTVEIREIVRKPTDVIRRVCKREGVKLIPVFEVKARPPRTPVVPEPPKLVVECFSLSQVGDGLKPFDRSIAIMEYLGRYSQLRQGDYPVHLLDGKATTPYQLVTEASRELIKRGHAPIGLQWG